MSRLIKLLLQTKTSDLPALISRLTLALVILPHGLQKTLGWFGFSLAPSACHQSPLCLLLLQSRWVQWL